MMRGAADMMDGVANMMNGAANMIGVQPTQCTVLPSQCTVGEKGHLSVTLYFSQKYFYPILKIFYNFYQIFSKNILLKSDFQFG